MENVLKRIFSGKSDDDMHNEFIKFSRGIFANRYLLYGKKQKDKWTIKTGCEFANFLVRRCLEKSEGEISATGIIVYTGSLGDSKIPIERVKQFMGIKQYVINSKVKVSDVLEAMDKYPKAFFALTFSIPTAELKIKAKAPKSSKPSTKGDAEVKADFCSLKTTNKELVEDLFFDFPQFNEIKIKHILDIEKVIIPTNISDPVKMREMSKRKGKIIRDITVDGKTEKKEVSFEA
ncbi:MAG: hypothetical protein Q7S27_06915 [Nanoarchaeota archaeon]|nr:hypothetical protein [Nanoarchaeota archaeon]